MKVRIAIISALVLIPLFALAELGLRHWSLHNNTFELQRKALEKDRTEKWLSEMKTNFLEGKTDYLRLYSSQGTDSILTNFAGMAQIKKISLQFCDVTEEGLNTISEIPNLNELILYACNHIDATSIGKLQKSESLRTLRLLNLNLKSDAFVAIGSIPNLEYLSMFNDRSIAPFHEESSYEILLSCRNLKKLSLGGQLGKPELISYFSLKLPACQVIARMDIDDDEW